METNVQYDVNLALLEAYSFWNWSPYKTLTINIFVYYREVLEKWISLLIPPSWHSFTIELISVVPIAVMVGMSEEV